MVSVLAYGPSCPGVTVFTKKNSKEKIVDVAGINHLCCLEKSGRWLENVDPTHLVLASGKLVLKKHSPSLKIISIA